MSLKPHFSARLLILKDSLDELQMDDYWKEVENISFSGGGGERGEGEVQEEELQKIPEGEIHIKG